MSQSDSLVVLNTDTGEVVNHATRQLHQLMEENDALKGEIGRHAVMSKRLRGEQVKRIEEHSKYEEAMRVLEQWRRLCAPRTKELNGPRLANCVARLSHGYSEEELAKAVVGYSRYPYVVDGRRCAVGPKDKRYVDAELIFRDAKRVDAGIAMAEADESQPKIPTSVMATLDWRSVQQANYDLLKTALEKEFGGGLQDEDLGAWHFPCPRCYPDYIRDSMGERIGSGTPLTLLLVVPPTTSLARCTVCDVEDKALLLALKDPVGLGVV